LPYTAGHKSNDMPGTSPSTPQAASQALAATESYTLHVRQLVTNWRDTGLYHSVSLDMQEVRRCCQRVPALSAPWVALLLAHTELMQSLWRSGQPQAILDAAERQRLLAQVLGCAQVLQECGIDLAVGPGDPQ
jgi:hypothetical protein